MEKGLVPPVTPEAKIKNDKAKGLILMSVGEYVLSSIVTCATAKEMWDKLKQTREKCDPCHGMLALNEHASSLKRSDETMLEYWSRKGKLLYKIRGAGIVMSDKLAAIHLIMGLPAPYDYLKRTIKMDDDFDLQNFQIILLEEEAKVVHTVRQEESAESSSPRHKYNVKRGYLRSKYRNMSLCRVATCIESRLWFPEEVNEEEVNHLNTEWKAYGVTDVNYLGTLDAIVQNMETKQNH